MSFSIRRRVMVQDLSTVCPHWFKYCYNTNWSEATRGCFVNSRSCPMYEGIRDGVSPWEWRIPPQPDSDWWKTNTDEISLRELDKYQVIWNK